MTQDVPPYNLWFQNRSTAPGVACIYQHLTNIVADVRLHQLAWMVTGANPSVWVHFQWSLDYSFIFIDQGPPRSQQAEPADLVTANSAVFSHNQFGYVLSTQSVPAIQPGFLINEDASVPPVNSAIVGIGMHGAGTFAAKAGPNEKLSFKPAPTLDYSYSITFGPYTFEAGDVLDVAILNRPGAVHFPADLFSMTAILGSSNLWTISHGAPAIDPTRDRVVPYEAGKGLLLESERESIFRGLNRKPNNGVSSGRRPRNQA